jgi:hypothetical protein
MFLSGFYMQSHAAVNTSLDTKLPTSCDVFSADEEKKEGDKKEGEEEEPDCE